MNLLAVCGCKLSHTVYWSFEHFYHMHSEIDSFVSVSLTKLSGWCWQIRKEPSSVVDSFLCLNTLSEMVTRWLHLWRRRWKSWNWDFCTCSRTLTYQRSRWLCTLWSHLSSRNVQKKELSRKFPTLVIVLRTPHFLMLYRVVSIDGFERFKRLVFAFDFHSAVVAAI